MIEIINKDELITLMLEKFYRVKFEYDDEKLIINPDGLRNIQIKFKQIKSYRLTKYRIPYLVIEGDEFKLTLKSNGGYTMRRL